MGCSRRQALGLPRGLSASLVLYHTAQGSRQSWCLLSKCCSCSLLPILGRAATRNCPSLELLMQRQCPDGFFFSALYCYWICVLVFIYILDSKGSPVLEYIQTHRRGHIREFSLTASWGKAFSALSVLSPGLQFITRGVFDGDGQILKTCKSK